jgi:hypothetical protein
LDIVVKFDQTCDNTAKRPSSSTVSLAGTVTGERILRNLVSNLGTGAADISPMLQEIIVSLIEGPLAATYNTSMTVTEVSGVGCMFLSSTVIHLLAFRGAIAGIVSG